MADVIATKPAGESREAKVVESHQQFLPQKLDVA